MLDKGLLLEFADFGVILLRLRLVGFVCILQNLFCFCFEVFQKFGGGSGLELLYSVQGLVQDVTSDHFAAEFSNYSLLVWQVKLFVFSDCLPRLGEVKVEAVNRYIVFRACRKKGVLTL